MSASFWQSVLAMKTFNSSTGRMVQKEAVAKLKKLDKSLDDDLLGEIAAFYLREAPYDLWPALKHIRKEHAPVFAAELAKHDAFQAKLAAAAYALDPASGLQDVGELMAAFAKCSHLPGLWKSLTKNWDKLPGEQLVPAAVKVLAAREAAPNLTEIMALFGLVFVVARQAPSAPVLAELRARSASWKGWENTVNRAIAAATGSQP